MAVNNLNTPGVGIQPSLIDAKGDLLVGTANDAIDRLGVTGTTGAVLTADAGETTGLKWAAAGSVGGLVHINTTDFSAVASQSINDVFSASYDVYKIVIRSTGSGVGQSIRLRVSGADNSASVYRWTSIGQAYTLAASGEFTRSVTSVTASDVSAGSNIFTEITIASPFLVEPTNWTSIGNDSGRSRFWYGHHESSTSFTGFSYFPASGTITGAISVYGYRK